MDDVQRAQLCYRIGSMPTCEGRTLSLHNTLLLLLQSGGTASMVGGFRQWLRVGRCVRKGEHGLSIWIPIGAREGDAQAEEGREPEENDTRFIMGTVFDVSQTEPVADREPVEA